MKERKSSAILREKYLQHLDNNDNSNKHFVIDKINTVTVFRTNQIKENKNYFEEDQADSKDIIDEILDKEDN